MVGIIFLKKFNPINSKNQCLEVSFADKSPGTDPIHSLWSIYYGATSNVMFQHVVFELHFSLLGPEFRNIFKLEVELEGEMFLARKFCLRTQKCYLLLKSATCGETRLKYLSQI